MRVTRAGDVKGVTWQSLPLGSVYAIKLGGDELYMKFADNAGIVQRLYLSNGRQMTGEVPDRNVYPVDGAFVIDYPEERR